MPPARAPSPIVRAVAACHWRGLKPGAFLRDRAVLRARARLAGGVDPEMASREQWEYLVHGLGDTAVIAVIDVCPSRKRNPDACMVLSV